MDIRLFARRDYAGLNEDQTWALRSKRNEVARQLRDKKTNIDNTGHWFRGDKKRFKARSSALDSARSTVSNYKKDILADPNKATQDRKLDKTLKIAAPITIGAVGLTAAAVALTKKKKRDMREQQRINNANRQNNPQPQSSTPQSRTAQPVSSGRTM